MESMEKYFGGLSKKELPYNIFLFMQSHFETDTSKRDPNLTIYHPRDTLKHKKIDCDDAALFFHYFYSRAGMESNIALAYFNDRYQRVDSFGTIFSLFKVEDNPNWFYIDNNNLVELSSINIKAAMNKEFSYFAERAMFIDGDKLLKENVFECSFEEFPPDNKCFWVRSRDK